MEEVGQVEINGGGQGRMNLKVGAGKNEWRRWAEKNEFFRRWGR